MACCGSEASISVESNSNIEAHHFTVTLDSNETDTRSFGSGAYGDWEACAASGTIEVRSYLDQGVDIGWSNVDIVTNACGVVTNYLNCVCTNLTTEADAKGLVEFVGRYRITGDPT